MNKYAIDFTNYDEAKSNLKARLYNKSKDVEVFRSAAEYGFDDLIIVPYVDGVIEIGESKASAKITEELLDIWGVDDETVIWTAIANTDYEITTIAELLQLPSIPEFNMTVVTNAERHYGAIGAILARHELKTMFSNGYVVIPSSIHEVIIMDINAMDENYMTEMIGEVNEAMVNPEEWLGNHPYRFVV